MTLRTSFSPRSTFFQMDRGGPLCQAPWLATQPTQTRPRSGVPPPRPRASQCPDEAAPTGVDLALQSTSHRGVPHFLLPTQSTVKAKRDMPSWGHQGQLDSKIGGGSVISTVNDEGSEAATMSPAPCSSVGRPVQLGFHPRAAWLPRPASKASSPSPTLDAAALPSLHRDALEIRRPKGRLSFHRRRSRKCTQPSLFHWSFAMRCSSG